MLEFKNFSFRYEGIKDNIVSDISFTVNKGEIALLCGKSGSGKSTLVRSIKPMYNQKGQSSGEILYNGKNVKELSMKELSKIGYISQDIENQIVTDKVWHELSFGLENLGLKNSEIRLRCGEMAAYFGIESWYNKKTSDLSTGQKQLLNLASVMIMRPDILVLDEPVSTLDPVAASEILERIFKLNRDFGTTILIVMHELEEIYAMVSKVIFIDQKAVVMPAREMANYMLRNNNDQVKALPQSARICGLLNRRENKEITKDAQVPISIAQGRDFVENNKELLDKYYKKRNEEEVRLNKNKEKNKAYIELKHIYFKYDKESPFILEDLNLSVEKGQVVTIMGGNGSGKSTLISLISKLNIPVEGKIKIGGRDLNKIPDHEIHGKLIGFVPQEPRNLFMKESVLEEIEDGIDISVRNGNAKEDIENKAKELIDFFGIKNILKVNPFDISGGEMQKLALIKVLLGNTDILIMDEPTKGMDGSIKAELAGYIKALKEKGITIVLVSHDVEFSARVSDRIGFLFDRHIISEGNVYEFISDNHFYTTVTRRISRDYYEDVIIPEDFFRESVDITNKDNNVNKDNTADKDNNINEDKIYKDDENKNSKDKKSDRGNDKKINKEKEKKQIVKSDLESKTKNAEKRFEFIQKVRKLRNIVVFIVFLYVLMLGISKTYADQRYFVLSILLLFISVGGVYFYFEKRNISQKRLVIIATLTAIGIVGRVLFYMVPGFKPVAAISIIAGIALDPFSGFLCGSLMAFLSNSFFGQGSWTAFQMFGFGLLGFLGGFFGMALDKFKTDNKTQKDNYLIKRIEKKEMVIVAVYGFFTTFILYGFLMNFFTSLTSGRAVKEMLLINIISGIPLDIIHGASTAIFLLIIGRPVINRVYRVKYKYEI